jgi:Skp family chaperone for outer membrane proteins
MKNDLLKRTTLIGAAFTLAIVFSQSASAQERHRADSTARLNKEKHQEKREEHKLDKKAEKSERKEDHKEKKVAKAEDKIEKSEKRDEKREGKRIDRQERHPRKDSTSVH